MIGKDYYAILGVRPDATAQEIKGAFRSLAHRYHPDISDEPDAEARFKEIGEAYEALSDPARRFVYDRHADSTNGAVGPRDPAGVAEQDNAAPRTVFSRVVRRKRRPDDDAYPVRGEDYLVTAAISLEQVVRGAVIDLACDIPEQGPGDTVGSAQRNLKVRLPKGARHGDEVVLKGQGGPGANGGVPGDFYVRIEVMPHPLFRVHDDHLVMTLPIAPWEAVRGAKLTIPTLEKPVPIRVPRGARSGQQLLVPARGLPTGEGKRRGDLYLVLTIVTPQTVSEAEERLYERLASISTFDPRRGLF